MRSTVPSTAASGAQDMDGRRATAGRCRTGCKMAMTRQQAMRRTMDSGRRVNTGLRAGSSRRTVTGGRDSLRGRTRDASQGPGERPAASGCQAARCRVVAAVHRGRTVRAPRGSPERHRTMATGAGMVTSPSGKQAVAGPTATGRLANLSRDIRPRLDISLKRTGGAEAVGTMAAAASRGRPIARGTSERGGARKGLASLRDVRCPPIPRGRTKQASCRGNLVRRLAATARLGCVERGRGRLTGRTGTRRTDQRPRLTSRRCVTGTPLVTSGTKTSLAATPAAVLGQRTGDSVAIAGP